tara:strand:- start:970 stop:1119 length:150 start_codon:yes stop_codon:yes gene_type:complete
MVGDGRLELPTSTLSVWRSNRAELIAHDLERISFVEGKDQGALTIRLGG